MLAIVGKVATVPTGEGGAYVKDGHAAPATSFWAEKPRPRPTIIAACPFKPDQALTGLRPVIQAHDVRFRMLGGHNLDPPPVTKEGSATQPSSPVPLPHI
jgi:hypothetical protein